MTIRRLCRADFKDFHGRSSNSGHHRGLVMQTEVRLSYRNHYEFAADMRSVATRAGVLDDFSPFDDVVAHDLFELLGGGNKRLCAHGREALDNFRLRE